MTTASVPSSSEKISSFTAVIPTPSYGTKGVFSIIASINIKATASAVLKALEDVDSWGQWNSFVPEAEVVSEPRQKDATVAPEPLKVGTQIMFSVYMNGNGLSSDTKRGEPHKDTLELTVLEELTDGRKGYRVAWKDIGYPGWALYVERVHEIVEKEDGTTEYTNWETFGGPLSYVVKLVVGRQLLNLFDGWGKDLKNYVEPGSA